MTPAAETVIHRIVLDMICKVPNPFRSEEDGLRFYNQDLLGMSKAELNQELKRVELRLLIDTEYRWWLRPREVALKGLLYGTRR